MTDMIECLNANQHRSSANIVTGDFNCPNIYWHNLTSPNDRIHRPFWTLQYMPDWFNWLHYPQQLETFWI